MINNNFSPSIDKAIKALKICGFDFLEKLMLQHKRFSFLSLLVFLPLFITISFESNHLISFNRSVWIPGEFHNDLTGLDMTQYFTTFPFSLIIVSLLAIKYFSKIIVNKSYQLTMGWILFVLIINFTFGNVSGMLIKIIGGIIIFSTSILVFDEYFSRKNSSINNAKEKISFEDFYILKPFLLFAFILLASLINYRDDTLIFPWLKIYNFDQYLSYSLFIFIGIFFRKKWQLIFVFVVVGYFIYFSRSYALIIMLMILFIGYLMHVTNFNWLKKYTPSLMLVAIFCTILFQFISYFLPSARDFLPFGLSVRMEIISVFYKAVSFSNLFIPLHSDIKIINYLHNEVLTLLAAIGFLGVFLHYKVLYNRIKIILNRNIGVALTLSMVIIIGGALVLPTLHPFTGIIIAYLISFYSNIGNIRIK